MTAPLTPPDCDLRDFQFMPLDVQRLRDSDLAALESPEACWAAVQLWGASWHQVPAASLPDDDRVLAQLAGYGRVVREWMKVRSGALRGFVKASDGRLYHPVVAEKAVEAWRGKLEQRWRTECARIKKANQRHGTDDPIPTLEEFLSGRHASVPRDDTEIDQGTTPNVPGDSGKSPSGNGIQGKGKGTGTGTNSSEDKSSGAESADPDFDKLAWDGAVRALTKQGGMAEKAARTYFGKVLSESGVRARDLLPVISGMQVNATQDPQGYLRRAAQNVGGRQANREAAKAVGFV